MILWFLIAGGVASGESTHQYLWSGDAVALARGSASAADVCVIGGDLTHLSAGNKSPGQQWLIRINPLNLSDPDIIEKAEAESVPMVADISSNQPRRRLDLNQQGWMDFAIMNLLVPALGKVGDGWVLEGFDESTAEAARALVKRLEKVQANRRVFIAGAVGLNLNEKSAGAYIEGNVRPLLPGVRSAVTLGMSVLAAAFGDPSQSIENQELADELIAAGALTVVTTADRTGISLAPLRERSRRVLVLYGWDRKETEKPLMVPADTLTAELLQAPLEWMGYEVDYASVTEVLPASVAGRWAAVIVDGETHVPGALELIVAQWLAKAKDAGLPILFTGTLPFTREDAFQILVDEFGLRGSLGLPDAPLRDLVLSTSKAGITGTEAPLIARADNFRDLQAPEKSDVLVGLSARGADGHPLKFHPVFLTAWGGMWLDPYLMQRASQDNSSFLADPYQILSALLAEQGQLPAPDTTTRDGRRLFYSHIDGDGFASLSAFKGHPFCAEMVRDRILNVFPIPVTVSVVESDVRAWSEGLKDEWQPRIEQAARSLFAMSNVQAASHTFSHPYCWDAQDPNPGIYTEPNLKLKPAANYPGIVLDREIRGSVDYINRTLLPPGKQVELFLWSGNCRPGSQALSILRTMNLENMNGGDTVISRLYPGMACVAPRVTPWGDELQINAANQNEFMYSNGWEGPFYGGFAKVIDTFERTEVPRRMKPVNVYYHFYSAMNLSSLRALEKIHHWCMEQPLHAVTALQFAQLTRDAWRTRLFDLGPRHWLIANDGHCRTLRMPASAGRPYMAQSKGVTGWTIHADSLYIHTSGQPRTELVLVDVKAEPLAAAEAHLYLDSSDAEIEFTELSAWSAEFTTRSLKPSTLDFGGLPARATGRVFINDQPATVVTDERGHLTLAPPPVARVRIAFDRSRYVSLR